VSTVILRSTTLAGVFLLEPDVAADERGSFARIAAREELEAHGLDTVVDHVALSRNHRRATLRGLHFQAPPYGQAKLVRCLRGAIYDVIVDVRPGSSRYLAWEAFELGPDGPSLYIPAGFAHGFETLEDETEVYYQISAPRRAEAERGILWDDPLLGIEWPLPPTVISTRDSGFPLLPTR
jgi:dTDP-4-dehydrorhamnose 3,5-epimerase